MMGEAVLCIFDLDGTLVETYGELVLPGVASTLTKLVSQQMSIAVATNQAGPAWRMATGDMKYPDPMLLGARLARIAQILPQLSSVPWFVAIGDGRLTLPPATYQNIADSLRLGAKGLKLHVAADLVWRKPEPGMLRAACTYYGVSERGALFVGDSEADVGAAGNAAVRFVDANCFFHVSDAAVLDGGGHDTFRCGK